MPPSLGQLWLPILAPRVHNIPATALANPTTLSAPELVTVLKESHSYREQNCAELALAGLVCRHRAGQRFSPSILECSASSLPSRGTPRAPKPLHPETTGRGWSREVTRLL